MKPLFAIIDIKDGRLCPVQPEDYQLLGMFWQGQYYIDTRLPFGGRSSPFIFNNFADALGGSSSLFVASPMCYIIYNHGNKLLDKRQNLRESSIS